MEVFIAKAFAGIGKEKFESLIDHYLDDPRSPMRNDRVYLLFLRGMKSSMAFDEAEKERIDFKIKMHDKNLPGTTAIDFSFKGKDGKPHRLSDYKDDSDRVTSGSSLMPQKKNPDALELIRDAAPGG